MTEVQWHLRITLASSARDEAKQIARSQRRTPANYVASLIETDQGVNRPGDKGTTP